MSRPSKEWTSTTICDTDLGLACLSSYSHTMFEYCQNSSAGSEIASTITGLPSPTWVSNPACICDSNAKCVVMFRTRVRKRSKYRLRFWRTRYSGHACPLSRAVER